MGRQRPSRAAKPSELGTDRRPTFWKRRYIRPDHGQCCARHGEYDLGGSAFEALTGNISLGGTAPLPVIQVADPLLRGALAAAATSPEASAALAALPSTATLNGEVTFAIGGAEAKALGVIPADDPAIDGLAGFSPSFTGTGLTRRHWSKSCTPWAC